MKEVKLCPVPSCGHHNPVGALFCEICQFDLGDVPFTRLSEPADISEHPEPDSAGTIGNDSPAGSSSEKIQISSSPAEASESNTSSLTEALSALPAIAPVGLSLICPNGRVIQVNRADAIIGQYDPEKMQYPLADVQLLPSKEMPDIRYIHRRHCRLEFKDGQWFVTPLAQPHLNPGFSGPNPTFIGDRLLSIGEAFSLSDQDILTIGCLPFTVRIRSRSGFSHKAAGNYSEKRES